ncbi:hypothetical protein [Fluviispira sanaruensis]|uniref:Uncharacterized protein n=1 Tax=Fluviispira sanaruensis TaxID=2493639 RepID=A0A4P2W038_FLUSA|nr:hypothetical protein [Fluviispira sanaruensis]BBH54512.1 hypothetical protein JCM31447_29830 [Fluviispira sanaruensis]
MQTYKDDFIPQYESIEIPKKFLENKTFNLYITHQNKDYCLKLNDNYIYLSEGCKVSPKWNYTNLGQIITKINDGREEQFYCMSIDPAQTDFGQNILLSPCDLNNTGQFWQLKQSTLNNGMSFVNFNNVYLKAKKRYLYIYPKRNEKIEEIITIKNHPDLEENKTEPLIQFSIDNDKNEGNFRIFPSKQGYAIIDKRRYADSDYMTYYNAHNNMLFTNQHKNFIKPQLCYMSSLLKKRGSSWGWVWSEHCSNVDETKKEYKWYINFKSEGKYFITDNAGHLLRKHNVNKYVYTAYKYWTDGYDVFTQYFILPAYLEKFAKSFSTVAIDKEKSYLKAFKVIKNDFEEKYLKCMYLEICI